jgi:hypothetical protein
MYADASVYERELSVFSVLETDENDNADTEDPRTYQEETNASDDGTVASTTNTNANNSLLSCKPSTFNPENMCTTGCCLVFTLTQGVVYRILLDPQIQEF